MADRPLIAVLGPTGSGKSELGLALAGLFDGEIVNCDSIQVYRGLNIGSAKVPLPERRGIEHHLIDIASPHEELTAGAYSRLASLAVSAIQDRGKLPIVVGGTGLYFRALIEGLSPAPPRDEQLRNRLRKIAARRPSTLHRLLLRHDPQAAARIHPNDHQKLIRAIELLALSCKPASQVQSAPRSAMANVKLLKIGLAPERSLLNRHLDRRSAWMFQHGLLAETKTLLASGVLPGAKPLQSLGYKQAVKVLTQGVPWETALRECQVRTRQYAKRQMTWFRAESGMHWLVGFGGTREITQEAECLTQKFLNEFRT